MKNRRNHFKKISAWYINNMIAKEAAYAKGVFRENYITNITKNIGSRYVNPSEYLSDNETNHDQKN